MGNLKQKSDMKKPSFEEDPSDVHVKQGRESKAKSKTEVPKMAAKPMSW